MYNCTECVDSADGTVLPIKCWLSLAHSARLHCWPLLLRSGQPKGRGGIDVGYLLVMTLALRFILWSMLRAALMSVASFSFLIKAVLPSHCTCNLRSSVFIAWEWPEERNRKQRVSNVCVCVCVRGVCVCVCVRVLCMHSVLVLKSLSVWKGCML